MFINQMRLILVALTALCLPLSNLWSQTINSINECFDSKTEKHSKNQDDILSGKICFLERPNGWKQTNSKSDVGVGFWAVLSKTELEEIFVDKTSANNIFCITPDVGRTLKFCAVPINAAFKFKQNAFKDEPAYSVTGYILVQTAIHGPVRIIAEDYVKQIWELQK